MNSIILLTVLQLVGSQSTCKSMIFCQGDLLHAVQMSKLFKDSKTFVDMSLVSTEEKTLQLFDKMLTVSNFRMNRSNIEAFVLKNFRAKYDELDTWTPSDFKENPPFLDKIDDPEVKSFAKKIVSIWPKLGRKMKPQVAKNPTRYSIIYVPNGFIAPGGRFREMYYWDSLWIIKGLLVSGMKNTVKGMLENFFALIKKVGFVPNGSRIYYLDRSQPPLLTIMVQAYMDETQDFSWLKRNILFLDTELSFWLNNRTIKFEISGKTYRLGRYKSNEYKPRPESYREDFEVASNTKRMKDKEKLYNNIRSAAESGWDFSSRWFFDSQNSGHGDKLETVNTTRIIQADLNSYLCGSFKILSNFYLQIGEKNRSSFWHDRYEEWKRNINEILYNEADGVWYDFDKFLKTPRKHFYPSNLAPLWTKAYDTTNRHKIAKKVVAYLKKMKILDFDGGVPTSLHQTGQQWDLPNAWPPLQSIVIFGLEKTGVPEAQAVGIELAKKWIQVLMKAIGETDIIFEKYDAIHAGNYGGGGEYEVQTGFGWTNGVLLELIDYYYGQKKIVTK